MKIFLFVLALLLLLSIGGCSLEYKYSEHKYHFEDDIQALEQLTDYENLQDYLLFIGSSSIKRWDSMEKDMSPYTIVKRGYGGAHYYDLIHFIDRLIINKQKAKAVIIFVANDITIGDRDNYFNKRHSDLTPKEVTKLFKSVTKKISSKLGENLPIFVIETTPTASRWHVWKEIAKANELIKSFTEKKSNLNYISTRKFFLNEKNYPIGEYFLSDSLHLNDKGYDLWQGIIKKSLKERAL